MTVITKTNSSNNIKKSTNNGNSKGKSNKKNWEGIGKKNSNCIITSYVDINKAKRHHHVVFMCGRLAALFFKSSGIEAKVKVNDTIQKHKIFHIT